MNAFKVVDDFEAALCEYTGAPYCVTTTSCTQAILMAVAWHLRQLGHCRVCGLTGEQLERAGGHLCDRSPCDWQNIRRRVVSIPKRTYVGVPYAIIEAGGRPTFRDEAWIGTYQLKPLPVWDSARWFTSGLWKKIPFAHEAWPGRQKVCVSFHWSKTLGIQQGGAILLDDEQAYLWLRRARFDGRTPGVPPAQDTFELRRAWHAYMSPETAAAGLVRLAHLPPHNQPIPNDAYPDLSTIEAFK